MKFGQVDEGELSRIDLGLPPDLFATSAYLKTLSSPKQSPSIYIGCSVWADRGFVGKIYPPKTAAKAFLSCYSRQFNTVELNTTFYGIPPITRVQQWREAVPPSFRFCPKFPQSISHRNYGNKQQQELLERFIVAMSHLGELLGPSFLQLPPHFKPNKLNLLRQLLEAIPGDFPMAVELRHPLWFSDVGAQKEVMALLQERGIAAVITDVAGRRDVLHQRVTAETVFVRFTGNNLHPTDFSRIDAWVERLQEWISRGISTIYFLLHEPEKSRSADLAVYLINGLNKIEGVALPQLSIYPSLELNL